MGESGEVKCRAQNWAPSMDPSTSRDKHSGVFMCAGRGIGRWNVMGDKPGACAPRGAEFV